MSFTMPQFEILEGDEVNPLAGILNKSATVSQNRTKAKYLPMTLQADAMSKMAYANLMAPQFLAKLMGNPDVVANMTEEQKQQALGMVTAAGMGQGTGSGLLSMISQFIHGGKGNPNQQAQGGGQSTMSQPQTAPQQQTQPQQVEQTTPENRYQYNPDGSNITADPNEVLNNRNDSSSNQADWSTNAGIAAGRKAQGEEAGKLRAQDVQKLSDVVLDATNQQANMDMIGKILKDPELEKIKTFPVQGHQQLSWYAATGTPHQKELIGQLRGGLKNQVIQDSTQFKGSFRGKEQDLLDAGLPNENDTLDTMKGKYIGLSSMRKMLIQRTQIVSDLIDGGMNKNQAIKQADKWVHGDKIRAEVEDSMYPPIKIRNKKTGEEKMIPYSQRNNWTQ